jgi:tetratricopeptide (TPR) repeat protein
MAEWGRLPARFRATHVIAKRRQSGVLIAEDLEAGGTVLVRVLPARGLDQDLRAYLERTRRCLATVNTPPMQVIDSGRVALLSRAYLPGQTLDERLAGPPGLTMPEFLHIAASAVGALGALHDLGVVHGNIKGSNLVLCERVLGVEGPLSLVDHGMGRLTPVLDHRLPSKANPVPMDAAADVSAMATLLRASFEQVLREQAGRAGTASPVEKRLAYLARDVLSRLAGSEGTYNSLAAAAKDLGELSSAHRSGVLPELTPGSGDLRHELSPAGFVARPAEWELLTTALGAAREVRSRSVLVQGPAGIGKTRLCREFARWAGAEESARCIYVKSEPTVASRPHLVAYQLMQELHQERPESGTPRHGVLRPTDAARRLVAELGELAVLHNPVVVTIDDCHFARAEDVAMMQSLAEMLPAIGPGVLVIFIRRSVTAAHHAPAVKTQHDITMTALRPHSVRAILASMAGRIDDAVVDEVVTWADGSPLHAQNAIRFLVDHGAVVPSPRGWTSAGHLPVPPSVLADRLRSLPLPARRMLTTAAVIGYRGRMDVLAGATGTSPEACAAEVAELVRQGFLEHQIGSHIPMFGFAHDTVRDAALADDTGTHVAQLHRRVAEAMLESAGTDEFDLAFHLAKAGDPSAAYPYAVAAARTARRRYSLGTAREYYELALSARATDDLLRELGEVLMLDGSYGDAAEVLTEALSRCAPRDLAARAQVSRLLGETYFKSGALEQAERCFLDALGVLGEHVPEGDRGFAVGLARELVRYGVRRITPFRRLPDGRAHIELRAAVLGNLAYCWWFHNSLKALWAQAREMELAHHCAVDGPERPHAYATHAVVCGALLGRTRRAVRYGEAAMSIRALGDDEWGEAHAMHLYGVALVASGDYQRAVDVLAVAVERFDRTADRWEAHTSRWHRAWALYRMGALEEAASEADIVAKSAAAIGDRQASVIAALTHALVSDGQRVDPALTEQVPDRYDAQTAIASLLGRAICALGSQDLDGASLLLDRAAEEIGRRRLINAYVAPVLSWRATVALWRADAARCEGGPNRRRALRGLALSVVAAAAGSVYAAERGHARQALRQSASALRAAFLPGIAA